MTWRHPATSQTGRQMNCWKGRQMNWRHPESGTPPARVGDKWIAIRGDKWIRDIRRAGHHEPDWERWIAIRGDMNWRHPESRTPPARLGEMSCYKGKQMNWRHPESRTPPARLGDKWIAIRGDKWIGDIRRAGHHQPDWERWIAIRGDKWIGDLRRAGHHHLDRAGHLFKRELRTPTVNCLGKK